MISRESATQFMCGMKFPEGSEERCRDTVELLFPVCVDLFQADKTGHDIRHARQVTQYALEIRQHVHAGDPQVIIAAGMLHDTHQVLIPRTKGKDSIPIVGDLLVRGGFPQEKIPAVLSIIEMHDNRDFQKRELFQLPDPHAALILRDADVIESLNVDRLIDWATWYCDPLYDDRTLKNPFIGYRRTPRPEEKVSAVDYAYAELLPITRQMHTLPGRQMAQTPKLMLRRFLQGMEDEILEGRFENPYDYDRARQLALTHGSLDIVKEGE